MKQVEPIITPGNEGIVHHMLIYSCWGLTNEHIVNNERTEGRCTTAEMPEFYDNCRHSYHAWAVDC